MRRAAAAAAALALWAAGCGGDEERKQPGGGAGKDTAPTSTQPSRETTPAATGEATARTTTSGGKPPEEQPGGAGDEEPARSEASLTGRGGRISPRLVQVPPFISVRVELRSADGSTYSLRIGGRRLSAGGGVKASSTTLDGLRSGEAYVGRSGDGGRIRIEASAEPGP